jgi:PEGA domain
MELTASFAYASFVLLGALLLPTRACDISPLADEIIASSTTSSETDLQQPAKQAQHSAQTSEEAWPIPFSSGSLSLETNAEAQISIDGEQKGRANGDGEFSLEDLRPGRYAVEVSLDRFETEKADIIVRPGSYTTVLVKLHPAFVPESAPTTVDYTEDYLGIQAALRRFEQAYDSRNMVKIQANWLNIGQRVKTIAGVMQEAEMVDMHEECIGAPTIKGNTAMQICTEVVRYNKSDSPKRLPKTITFNKTGETWVMQDKTP